MNEKIKELAIQASDWCCVHAKGTPTAWEWEYKFAELIVQECATYLNVAAEVYDQKDQDTVDRAARHIKQYFGLKD